MRLSTLLVLTSLAAAAQEPPEIRGTVTEYRTGDLLAGAEVILYEFTDVDGVYGRKPESIVVTNARGEFSVKPRHAGNYFMEVKKATYLTAEELDKLGPTSGYMVETSLTIESNAKPPNLRFILIRPGGLKGRVIDENDKPVPGITVSAVPSSAMPVSSAYATTNSDGVFEFPTLVPMPRSIYIGPAMTRVVWTVPNYTSEDITKVDEDVESAYWPSGVADPKLALPVDVVAGVTANIGTIRIRKVRYYRAHLKYAGECSAREAWNITYVDTQGITFSPCGPGLLLDKLLPGSRTLAIWNDRPREH